MAEIKYLGSRFTRGGWDLSVLNKYHQSETKLYTKHFMFPTMPSTVAPAAFDEPDMPGYAWVAYYRGKLVHPTGTRFRFWAQGDDIMIVRVNGEIVVDGSVADGPWADFRQALSDYQNSTARDGQYYLGHRKAEVGHWIDLEPGVPLDMEVLIGELPGGSFGAFLLVEEDGVEYANSPQNGPLLPIFKTDKLSHAELDAIYELLVEGEACPENGYGPIFSDYTTTVAKNDDEPQEEAFPSDMEENKPEKEEDYEVRTWTSADGSHTVVGHVVSSLDDSVFIETPEGKNIKLMLDQLSAADRTFLELAFPPQFKLTLLKSSKPRFIEVRSTRGANIPTILQWQFGARARQVGRKAYKHALTLEYYAVGQQVLDTDKYFLMDRAVSRFTPGPDNDYSHEFYGRRTAEVMKFTMYDQNMGRKFSGEYLVVLKDERGTIIGHNDTAKWLLENVDKLEKLPVGAFFDDTCTRIYPTSPPRWY